MWLVNNTTLHEWIINIIERHVIYKIYIIESECHCNAEWYESNIERIWIVDWIQMNNELIGRIKYWIEYQNVWEFNLINR